MGFWQNIEKNAKAFSVVKISEEEINTFENIEYKGIYGIDTPFVVQSSKAHILKGDADVVFMNNMKVIMNIYHYYKIKKESCIPSHNKTPKN